MPTSSHAVKISPIKQGFKQLSFDYDEETKSLWGYMNPTTIPNFSLEMLHEARSFDDEFERNDCQIKYDGEYAPVEFYVATSKTPGVFNLGGDLGLFLNLIKSKDRQTLTHYAHLCIDNIYARSSKYGHPNLTTIGFIQGDALGGGFELALANDYIIAERHAKFAFPEILFNLFPGMGALSFLERKVGLQEAKKIVSSGKTYSADELHRLGVVDVVAETGLGEIAVYDLIRKQERHWNGLRAIQASCNRIKPVTKDELRDVTDIWVDAAFRLNDKDLKTMERILRSQKNWINSMNERKNFTSNANELSSSAA
jgi:DSF synthase